MVAVAGARERVEAGTGTSGLNGSEKEDIGSLLATGWRGERGGDAGAGDGEVEDDGQELDAGDEGDIEGEEGDDGGAGAFDEEDDAEEPGTGAGESTAAERSQEEVEGWATRVAAKPLAIMQVPANRRLAVLNRTFALKEAAAAQATRAQLQGPVQQALDAMYQQGLRDAQEAATGNAEFEEMDALAADDPEAFAELALSKGGAAKAARYLQEREKRENPGQSAAADAIKASGARLMAKVNADPVALAKLKERESANPARYQATPEGLAALSEDIAEVLAEARAEAALKEKQPVAKAAADRRKAAEERSRLPRTGGSEGRGNGSGRDASLFSSARDDMSAGLRDMLRRR